MNEHSFVPRLRDYAPILECSGAVEGAVSFEHFYRAALPKVYRFVRCQVHDLETAQDIVSRVFLSAFRKWGQAPSGEEAVHWIFRIARNAVIDHWRGEGQRAAVAIGLEELSDIAGTALTPEAAYARRERAATLLRAMGSLTDQDRMLLALKFAGQRTNREVALILGISEAAVSMRLLRALRRLRERIGDQGF
jgi:RNA polymerase sigma factor (sigma-70 family)